MGKRARKRKAAGPSSFAELGIDLDLEAPPSEVEHELTDDSTLTLRTGMTPGTREEYAALARGDRSSAAATQEDDWARAVEFLFERLVVSWEVAGVVTEGAKPLLQRLRAATRDERTAIRAALRAHLAEHLPDVPAP